MSCARRRKKTSFERLLVEGACVSRCVCRTEVPENAHRSARLAAGGCLGVPPSAGGSFGARVGGQSARDRRWRSAASRAEMPPPRSGRPSRHPPRLSPAPLGFGALRAPRPRLRRAEKPRPSRCQRVSGARAWLTSRCKRDACAGMKAENDQRVERAQGRSGAGAQSAAGMRQAPPGRRRLAQGGIPTKPSAP